MAVPIEEDRRARDEHRSATLLTLLVFLWGAISLATVPWDPFWAPNVAQVVIAAPVLVYFLRTWNRPQRGAAKVIATILIAYALVLLPWTAVMWSRLGRPLEAFTVPQIAIVCVALVFVGRRWRGIATIGLFAGESFFAYSYARHVGLGDLIPISEPLATVSYTMLGIGLYILRWHRGDLTRKYIQVRAELQALERVRPLFVRARDQLGAQLNIVAGEVQGNGSRESGPPKMIDRALDRLGDLDRKLGGLLSVDTHGPSPQDAERRLRAHDAQLGAIFFAGLGVLLSVPVTMWSRYMLDDGPTTWFALKFVSDAAILIYLLRTRRRPSARRALASMLALYTTAMLIVTYNQAWLVQLDRPYAPFLGQKLLMVMMGLTLATRFKLGIGLILFTALHAAAMWFILDLGAHRDVVSLAEPWVTFIFMFDGLVSLRILEQRQFVSLRLLRAETEASTMRRRALMFLALRDRLNSPLQTLVLGAPGACAQLPDGEAERVQTAIDRLVDLSRELAEIDAHMPWVSASLDSDAELRHHG